MIDDEIAIKAVLLLGGNVKIDDSHLFGLVFTFTCPLVHNQSARRKYVIGKDVMFNY